MTAPHPRATGSYGALFLAWADSQPGLHPKRTDGLRWFQRLIATRLLEHDSDGVLVWRNVLVTLSRQCGKSWLIRALIVWRLQQRDLFGEEEQSIIHVAHKLVAAQEIWRPATFWGKANGWGVRIANGEQQLEAPDGSRWMVRAASDGVGASFSLSMLLVDEAWRVPRAVVEAADAALTEAWSPQLMLVSTAGDSSSDLFGTYRLNALDELLDPDNTLILEWSTPRGLPMDDPASWRLASPHWSERREREVADKLKKLETGEFCMNFLNWWLPTVRKTEEKSRPAFTEAELEAVNGTSPVSYVTAGVEDNFGEGLAVAFADLGPTGEARVHVELVENSADAAALLTAHAATLQEIVVGKSLLHDMAFAGQFRMTSMMMNARHATAELRRLLTDDGLRHDGSAALLDQALAIQIVDGVDGPKVRGGERLDAVKTTIWAAKAVRALPPVGQIY